MIGSASVHLAFEKMQAENQLGAHYIVDDCPYTAPSENKMRKIVTLICAALAASAMIAGSAQAQQTRLPQMPPSASPPSGGGGPQSGAVGGGGGGFRGDGFRGDGFRGGGFRGDGFRRGYYGGGFYGGGVFFGPAFGFYDPFWWPYGGFGYPYYAYPPRTVILREPTPPAPDYLIAPQAPPPQASWYRCSDPEGYYPYVRECNGQWQAVPVAPQGPPRG